MSLLRKAMTYLGLVDEDDYEGGDDYETYGYDTGDDVEDEAPRSRSSRAAAPPGTDSGAVSVIRPVRTKSEEAGSSAVAVKPVARPATRVHVMEPRGFNDAQEVGDQLKAGQPVILNLQGLDRDLQRRLIDFSSGLAYALNGTMSKAADQVFLLTPSNVEVSDEEKERLQARGLYRAAR